MGIGGDGMGLEWGRCRSRTWDLWHWDHGALRALLAARAMSRQKSSDPSRPHPRWRRRLPRNVTSGLSHERGACALT